MFEPISFAIVRGRLITHEPEPEILPTKQISFALLGTSIFEVIAPVPDASSVQLSMFCKSVFSFVKVTFHELNMCLQVADDVL